MASPDDPVQNNSPCPWCQSPTKPYGPRGMRKCSNVRCENAKGYWPSDVVKGDDDEDAIVEMLTRERRLDERAARIWARNYLARQRADARTGADTWAGDAGDEHTDERKPGAAAPRHPLPNVLSKQVASVATAEALYRQHPQTYDESIAQLYRHAAEEFWARQAPIAKVVTGVEDPAAALAAWMVTAAGQVAYRTFENLRQTGRENA